MTCITANTADRNIALFFSKEEGRWLGGGWCVVCGGWCGGFHSDLKHNGAKYTESQTKLKTHSTKFEAKHSK